MQTVLALDFLQMVCVLPRLLSFRLLSTLFKRSCVSSRLRIHQGAAAVFHLHEALQETPERRGETWRLENGITTRSVKSSLSSCRLNLLLLPSSCSSSFFIMFFQCFRTEKEYTHTSIERSTHTHAPMLNAALLSKYYTPNSNLFLLTVNLSGATQRGVNLASGEAKIYIARLETRA